MLHQLHVELPQVSGRELLTCLLSAETTVPAAPAVHRTGPGEARREVDDVRLWLLLTVLGVNSSRASKSGRFRALTSSSAVLDHPRTLTRNQRSTKKLPGHSRPRMITYALPVCPNVTSAV